MLKYLIVSMLIGVNTIHATNVQNLDKLEAEKKALVLKLEAYTIQKKIIEMENFIEQDKVEKEKVREREKALLQLKSDLRADRNRAKRSRVEYIELR